MEDGARVMYANDAACLHFGVSRATLLTWRPANWNPYFDASDMEALYRTLKSGDSVVFETEHRGASGELVPVEVMLLCQVRDGGRITIGYPAKKVAAQTVRKWLLGDAIPTQAKLVVLADRNAMPRSR
jgi:PAS domain-containing protein